MAKNKPNFKVYKYAKNFVICRMSKKLIVKILAAVEEANKRRWNNEIDLGVELPLLPRMMENAALVAWNRRVTRKELLQASAVACREGREGQGEGKGQDRGGNA